MTNQPKGEITFEYRGIIRCYDCTCDRTPEQIGPEPSDWGVHCYTCGASAPWPEHTQEYIDNYNAFFEAMEAKAKANSSE